MSAFDFRRIIIECDPEHLICATRAARWLIERPNQKDAIVAYGEGAKEVAFYIKRNKSSISVRQNHA